MADFDLRSALNAISDVVNNRPKALREFDQIYMKSADMLLQTEHVSKHVHDKRVVFIGDGDAIGLCLAYLHKEGHFPKGPASVHVLDFDERVVNSIRKFAAQMGISKRVTAELYNVAEPLPRKHWNAFDAFYTNPPFGKKNNGKSIRVFMTRGFEATNRPGAIGCVAIADDPDDPEKKWTQDVLLNTQRFAVAQGYAVTEFLPKFHCYHLDDAPDLRSCSMILRAISPPAATVSSRSIVPEDVRDFYGCSKHLETRFVRDHSTNGEDFIPTYELEKFDFDQLKLRLADEPNP